MFRRLNKDLQSHLTNLPAPTQFETTASHYKYLFQPLFRLQEVPFDSMLPHYLWFVKSNLARVSRSSNLNNHRLLSQNYLSNRIFPSLKNLFSVRKVSAGSTLFYQNPPSRSRAIPNLNPPMSFHFTPIWSTHYLYSFTTLRLLGHLPAPMRGRDVTENLFFEHGLLSKSFRNARRSWGSNVPRRGGLLIKSVLKRLGSFRAFVQCKHTTNSDKNLLSVTSFKGLHTPPASPRAYFRKGKQRTKFLPYRFFRLRNLPRKFTRTIFALTGPSFRPKYTYLRRHRKKTTIWRQYVLPITYRKWRRSPKKVLRRRGWLSRKKLPYPFNFRTPRALYKRIKPYISIGKLPSRFYYPTAFADKYSFKGGSRYRQPLTRFSNLSKSSDTNLVSVLSSNHSGGARQGLFTKPVNLTHLTSTRLPLSRYLTTPNSTTTTHSINSPLYSTRTTSLEPFRTRKFLRSPEFFLNLVAKPSPGTLDLVAVSRLTNRTFKFTTFPHANKLKTEIYRRLNRQKSSLRAGLLKLYKPTRNWKLNPHTHIPFRNRKLPVYNSSYLSNVPGSSGQLFSNGRPFRSARGPRTSTSRYLKLHRVQFKNNYGRMWREGRRCVRELINMPFKYQYRLTPKLQKLYIYRRRGHFTNSSMTIDYLLMTSRLVPDFWCVREAIVNHLVYLNANPVSHWETSTFVGDLIQLTVSFKFYVTLRWLRNWSVLRSNRVNKIYHSKYRPTEYNRHFKYVRDLPTWFYDLRFGNADVPGCVELDLFTLSVFVIHDVLLNHPQTPVRANLYNPTDLNEYNWKYIT